MRQRYVIDHATPRPLSDLLYAQTMPNLKDFTPGYLLPKQLVIRGGVRLEETISCLQETIWHK